MAEAKVPKEPNESLNEMVEMTVEDDYKKVKEMADELKNKNEPVVLHFTGNNDVITGKNWCSDCLKAQPVFDEFFKEAKFKRKIHLIHVQLSQEKLRDKNNHFAHDTDIKLREVPTMVLYKENKTLNASQCAQAEMLKLFFEDLLVDPPQQ